MKKIMWICLIACLILINQLSAQNREGKAGNGAGDTVFVEDACEIEGGDLQTQILIRSAIPVALIKAKEGMDSRIITPEEMKRLAVALTKGRYVLSETQLFNEYGLPFYAWTDAKNEGGVFAPIYIYPETWRVLTNFQENQKRVELSKLLLHEALHKVFPDLQNEADVNRLQEAMSVDVYCEKSHSCLTFPEETTYLLVDVTIAGPYKTTVGEIIQIQHIIRDYMDEHGTIVQSKVTIDDQRNTYRYREEYPSKFTYWVVLKFQNLYEKRKFKEYTVNSETLKASSTNIHTVDRTEMELNYETEYESTMYSDHRSIRSGQYLIAGGEISTNLEEFLKAQTNPWMYLKQKDYEKFKYLTLRKIVGPGQETYERKDAFKNWFVVRYFMDGGLTAVEFKSDWKAYQLMDHECISTPGDIKEGHNESHGFWLWPWNW